MLEVKCEIFYRDPGRNTLYIILIRKILNTLTKSRLILLSLLFLPFLPHYIETNSIHLYSKIFPEVSLKKAAFKSTHEAVSDEKQKQLNILTLVVIHITNCLLYLFIFQLRTF